MLNEKVMKKIYRSIFIIITIFIIISCENEFKFKVYPQDSNIFVNGENVSEKKYYSTPNKNIRLECSRKGYLTHLKEYKKCLPIFKKRIKVKLKPETYSIKIISIDTTADIVINNKKRGRTPLKLDLKFGIYDLELIKDDHTKQQFRLESKKDGKLFYRLTDQKLPIMQIGIFECGSLPKQVIFSEDDKYIYIPILNGFGFDIFSIEDLEVVRSVTAPGPKGLKGFPEGLIIKEKKVFWISQMTTGKIYEYSYPDMKYNRTIKTGGLWSKFMAWSSVLQKVAVSNWSSNDVSIINYETGKIVKKVKTTATPRGLAFSKDGKFLYVTTYDGGNIHKFDTNNWKETGLISRNYSAMRHIVLTKDDAKAYVSNMHNKEVYEIDTKRFKITNTYKVDYNPNTIALTNDDRYLFVSCRGPNDVESYLKRSPRNGRIAIIDLKSNEVVSMFEGGNQPTGLGLSNNNEYLCFSNFRDNNIELYWIGELNERPK